MTKKITPAEYDAWLEQDKRGYVALEKYINAKTHILHRCPVIGHEDWLAKPNHIKGGIGCPKCGNNSVALSKAKTHADYEADLLKDGRGYLVISGVYKNNHTHLEHQCPVADHHKWSAQPSNILLGKGCPYCSGHIAENYDEFLKNDSRGYVALEPYLNCMKKIKHQCPVSEDHKWSASPHNIKRGRCCPHCDPLGTDANVFYIWENADDQGVYKVGITSERCEDARIKRCANKNGMTANVILNLATPNAREIEIEALQMGDAADYPPTIDGYTEFRRYTDKQLGDVHRMAVNFGR